MVTALPSPFEITVLVLIVTFGFIPKLVNLGRGIVEYVFVGRNIDAVDTCLPSRCQTRRLRDLVSSVIAKGCWIAGNITGTSAGTIRKRVT